MPEPLRPEARDREHTPVDEDSDFRLVIPPRQRPRIQRFPSGFVADRRLPQQDHSQKECCWRESTHCDGRLPDTRLCTRSKLRSSRGIVDQTRSLPTQRYQYQSVLLQAMQRMTVLKLLLAQVYKSLHVQGD